MKKKTFVLAISCCVAMSITGTAHTEEILHRAGTSREYLGHRLDSGKFRTCGATTLTTSDADTITPTRQRCDDEGSPSYRESIIEPPERERIPADRSR
jgi:hypothetical protein